MLIIMNLFRDLDALTTMKLRELGHEPRLGSTSTDRFATLCAYTERVIPQARHTIHYSNEIRKNQKFRTHHQAIEEIVSRLRSGKSLYPYLSYLSKKAVQVGSRDSLLLSWGIHHLHLNTINKMDKRGFVARPRGNSELLMIRIHNQSAYLIDIVSHSEKDLFYNTRLLEIVDKNWPELHIELKSITGNIFTTEEIKALRVNGYNAAFSINNRTIMPRLGVMSSGAPAEIIRWHDALHDELLNVEANVRQRLYEFFPKCVPPTQIYRAVYEVRLVGIGDEFFILEEALTKHKCYARRVSAQRG